MINFHKYEGAGNDFIMINNLDGNLKLEPRYIKELCDRHFGIGADGLILMEKSDKVDLSRQNNVKVDCFMNYYNSDGTLAEMCGNGVRCTAKFFLEQVNQNKFLPYSVNIDTRAGIKNIKINEDETFSVNMGIPSYFTSDFPSEIINIDDFTFHCVSMGNPHAVLQVDSLEKIDVKILGSKIENNFHFPNKINVEFVEKIDDNYYKVRVWERGCGETLSCGTGACAVFAVLNKISARKVLAEEIILEFSGGKLFLSENYEGEIILRGPANFIFKGEV